MVPPPWSLPHQPSPYPPAACTHSCPRPSPLLFSPPPRLRRSHQAGPLASRPPERRPPTFRLSLSARSFFSCLHNSYHSLSLFLFSHRYDQPLCFTDLFVSGSSATLPCESRVLAGLAEQSSGAKKAFAPDHTGGQWCGQDGKPRVCPGPFAPLTNPTTWSLRRTGAGQGQAPTWHSPTWLFSGSPKTRCCPLLRENEAQREKSRAGACCFSPISQTGQLRPEHKVPSQAPQLISGKDRSNPGSVGRGVDVQGVPFSQSWCVRLQQRVSDFLKQETLQWSHKRSLSRPCLSDPHSTGSLNRCPGGLI